MKFFTRELHDKAQNTPPDTGQWEEVLRRYQEHVLELRPEIDRDWKSLLDLYIHDAELVWIDRDEDRSFVISIDLTNTIGSDIGFCKLVFYEIFDEKIIGEVQGDVCLYSELVMSENGEMVYSVLLWKSEISVSAKSVKLIKLNTA